MKIGGEYSSKKITPQKFEKLAEEADLTKPLMRRRVPELADAILTAHPTLDVTNPAAEGVAALIKKRSEKARTAFRI